MWHPPYSFLGEWPHSKTDRKPDEKVAEDADFDVAASIRGPVHTDFGFRV